MDRKTLAVLAVIAVIGAISNISQAATISYSEDFENGVGSEWSASSTYTTPTFTTHGNSIGLGRFGNQAVTLSLNTAAPHNEATVSFELYINNSWDGNVISSVGPDHWKLTQNGETLLDTTFSNVKSYTQSYPDNYSDGSDYYYRTGAAESNEDGFYGNSVYELSYTFDHTANFLDLTFSASHLQGLNDESWGIDNITVSIVPEPTSILLLGAALAGMRFKRK